MIPGLAFEELSHSYAYNGVRVPSVTKVMAPLVSYYRVPTERLMLAADRGKAVHALTEQWDHEGSFGIDETEHIDYLKAWVSFREDYDFLPTAIEERVYHPVHEYAGTADRFGMLKGHMSVIDIKTTDRLGPAVGVQLAAYQQAANANLPPRWQLEHRYAVQLCADGTYKLKRYKNPHDWPAFLGCLALYHWQQETHAGQEGEIRLVPLKADVTPPTYVTREDAPAFIAPPTHYARNDPRPLYG